MAADPFHKSRDESGESIEDVVEFAAFLAGETHAAVTAMGTCAGGWLEARAASRSEAVQRLIMVNNAEWGVSVARQYRLSDQRVKNEPDPRARQTAPDRPAFVRSGGQASYRLPYWAGYFLRKWFGIGGHAELLLRTIPSTTPLTMYLGESDWRDFVLARGQRALRRMIRRGRRMRVEVDSRLDHSLMSRASADAYIEILEREFADVLQSALPQG